MEVKESILTKECFPRLAYASRNIPSLQQRFYRMVGKAGIRGKDFRSDLPPLDSVHIFICKQKGESGFIGVQDTVIRNNEIIKSKPPVHYTTLSSFLDVPSLKLSVVITSTCLKDHLLELDDIGHMIVLVAKTKSEADELKKEFRSTGNDIISVFSTKESLASDISILLEESAYLPLKSQYTILQDLLVAKTRKLQDIPSEFESDEGFGYQTKRHIFDKPNAIREEAIELMCEEISALYDSTKIPKDRHPEKTTWVNKDVMNKERRHKLFSLCPTIKAVGNRFKKLHVYVANITNKNDIDTREKKIAAFMDQYKINDYAITPVFPQLKEFMFVGASVEARTEQGTTNKSGTLGCLAKMNEDHTMKNCLLLSKHVASHCNDVFLIKNGRERKVAKVIKSTTEEDSGSLDIAAAEIENGVVVECDARKLKDSVGIYRHGKLDGYCVDTRIIRPGKRVHIWGSRSQPGKGIVTDASYYIEDMSASLIQIQDEEDYNSAEENKRFALKGDSGGIVCSDDPDDEYVNAHAMLIGSDSNDTYLSLPLPEGVQQLEKKTGNKFILFE